jgi:ABC-type polysaccharide/polyol phosphate transport system ATPase subunit
VARISLNQAVIEFPIINASRSLQLRLYQALGGKLTAHNRTVVVRALEMIGAGDLQFIEKAKVRLHEIIGRASILALASHDLQMIRSVCNKVLWLERGAIKLLGEPKPW